MEEEAEEAGPERQQLGRGAAAIEEGDEEVGLERQQVGRRAVGGPERQQLLEAGPERHQLGQRGSGF